MALTWYRFFQWKRWVELFFSVPNLLLPLFYKVSVVTMKSSNPDIFFKFLLYIKKMGLILKMFIFYTNFGKNMLP
jgi:hypothetical protein